MSDEERRVHRWHDRLDIIVAMLIAVSAVIGWLHSDWKLAMQMDSIVTEIVPMVRSDHEKIIVLESRWRR